MSELDTMLVLGTERLNTQMNNDLEVEFLREEANKIIKGRFAETDEVAELVCVVILPNQS